jgi:hypothetical protein
MDKLPPWAGLSGALHSKKPANFLAALSFFAREEDNVGSSRLIKAGRHGLLPLSLIPSRAVAIITGTTYFDYD